MKSETTSVLQAKLGEEHASGSTHFTLSLTELHLTALPHPTLKPSPAPNLFSLFFLNYYSLGNMAEKHKEEKIKKGTSDIHKALMPWIRLQWLRKWPASQACRA